MRMSLTLAAAFAVLFACPAMAASPYLLGFWYGTGQPDDKTNMWLEQFLPLINGALEGVQRHLQAGQQAVSDEVRVAVAQAGYPPAGESLSRLALNVLLGLDGLSCVLVGMRRAAYVEDALGAVGLDRVPSLALGSI